MKRLLRKAHVQLFRRGMRTDTGHCLQVLPVAVKIRQQALSVRHQDAILRW